MYLDHGLRRIAIKTCPTLRLLDIIEWLGACKDILAEIYTVSNLGVFPSFKEPFGLVFVEA